uniref:Ig-like domain-containing protein n=1 Tax=Stomoxys calcitrans TaxID=35570 RepID=A0A1I8PK11_STOCA
MHFQNVNKAIWPLIFIIGLIEITGIESLENQPKGKQDVASTEFDYSEEGEAEAAASNNGEPSSKTNPYFETELNVAYATHEGENVTVKCSPKKFNPDKHMILWYNNESAINNGNITLMADKFNVDKNYMLTIYNYNSKTLGTIACEAQPGNSRQTVKIELKAPDNISEKSAAIGINMNYVLAIISATIISTFNHLY